MKPFPKYDFDISVRRESWERQALPSVASFYEDIFSVCLNYTVDLAFVPEFVRTGADWPSTRPQNPDVVAAPEEARLFIAAISQYVVTPDDSRAGIEEAFEQSIGGPAVLFFVTRDQFTSFCRELVPLAEERPAVNAGWPVSEIRELRVTKFIIERMLCSPYFAERHLRILGR